MIGGSSISVDQFTELVLREFDGGSDTAAIADKFCEKEFMVERALHRGLDRRREAKRIEETL